MRYFRLLKDWHHPLKTFERGSIHSSNTWAGYLGCGVTGSEFDEYYDSDRFEGWFKDITFELKNYRPGSGKHIDGDNYCCHEKVAG